MESGAKMIHFVKYSLAFMVFGNLVFIGCGKNNDQQGIPSYPLLGNPVYNCLPGQPCGFGSNILLNNFSAPLRFSGTMTLDRSQTDQMIKNMRSFQRQLNTG